MRVLLRLVGALLRLCRRAHLVMMDSHCPGVRGLTSLRMVPHSSSVVYWAFRNLRQPDHYLAVLRGSQSLTEEENYIIML